MKKRHRESCLFHPIFVKKSYLYLGVPPLISIKNNIIVSTLIEKKRTGIDLIINTTCSKCKKVKFIRWADIK